MDVFNAFKGVADMVREAIEGVMPRQAVVTRSEGTGVWVRYTPVNTSVPEMWFPSSIAGLPAGTSGWVHPLAGGKGQFIPWGAGLMPVTRYWAAQDATTGSNSTQTMQPAGSTTITIPVAGDWQVNAIGGFSAQHTAGASPILRVRIGSLNGPEVFGPPAIATVWTAQTASSIETLSLPQGNLTVTVEYRRGTTAGTISARNPWLNIVATKI